MIDMRRYVLVHSGTVVIETERLILRRFRLEDSEAMFRNWAGDPEVTKFLTWPTHTEVSASEMVIKAWLKRYEELTTYQWAIELKEIGEVIGSISVVEIKENIRAVEIGYCIGTRFWNKKITSEALKAVIEFFFDKVGANRIEARHDVNNPNSGRVMQKCGMKYEGRRIMADRNNQGIIDVDLYGIINPNRFDSPQ